jgi:hypothetical protein
MANVDLKKFPRDVQRLLKIGGIDKVSNYAGRVRDRPAPESATGQVNGRVRPAQRTKRP